MEIKDPNTRDDKITNNNYSFVSPFSLSKTKTSRHSVTQFYCSPRNLCDCCLGNSCVKQVALQNSGRFKDTESSFKAQFLYSFEDAVDV